MTKDQSTQIHRKCRTRLTEAHAALTAHPSGALVPGISLGSLDLATEYALKQKLAAIFRVAKVDVRLDYENLHIGLKRRGLKITPKALISAIRESVADLGNVVTLVAYADWGQLSRGAGLDIQRELDKSNVDTRYQRNLHGKNSADMKIADDVRTLIEKDTSAPDAVDVIVLGTGDRDFRPTIETAKQRGKKVVILALRHSISPVLERLAEVRFLEFEAKLTSGHRPTSRGPKPWDEHAELIMRVQAWLNRRGWKWARTDQLTEALAFDPAKLDRLQRAIQAQLLVRRSRTVSHKGGSQGQVETLAPNRGHPLVRAVRHLVEWLPDQITMGLQTTGWSYVDSNALAQAMMKDDVFHRLGVGQTRREAEGWLDLAAAAGIVVKKTQPHRLTPTNIVTTWWLPENSGPVANEGAPASEASQSFVLELLRLPASQET